MTRYDIAHQYGNTLVISLTLEDDDGDPVDITGYTVIFTIKRLLTDGKYVYQQTITSHTAPALGQTTITVPADNLKFIGQYWYDIRFDIGAAKQTYGIGMIQFSDVVNKG